ncbi:hypothetical protein [Tritonibacter mobilis]|uniref:hypothetical protein n=1 Tax=Tritonibacter mobilis TaxID=379347 RepID=UPI000A63E204|nr:hypothetical protein [Tritonibacter mobilis]
MIIGLIVGLAFSTATQLHTRRKQKKAQAQAEARRDKTLGVDITIDGSISKLPLVYGYGKVAGQRTQAAISDNGTVDPTPSGFADLVNGIGTGYQGGSKKEYLYQQIALTYAGIDSIVDIEIDGLPWDDPELRDEKGGLRIRYDLNGGKVDPTAANFGIKGASNKFNDMAYVGILAKLDRENMQFSGVPSPLFFVKGKKVRDIVFSNGQYSFSTNRIFSNNIALVIADYLTSSKLAGGCAYPDSSVDLISFHKVKTIADTVVQTDVPVRGYINGIRPTRGNLAAQPDAKRDIRLYECNVVLDTEKTNRENLDILKSCLPQGSLTFSNGQYKLVAEYPTNQSQADALVTATYTDADIIGNIERGFSGAETRYNRAVVRFNNESEDFKSDAVAWPEKGSTEWTNYMAQDANVENERSYTLTGQTTKQHALARAQEIVKESRIHESIKLVLGRRSIVHEIGDIIKVDSKAGDVENGLYRITNMRTNSLKFDQTIEAERFDWNTLSYAVNSTDTPPPVIIPSTIVENVTTLVWHNGSRLPDIKGNGWLTWNAPNSVEVQHYNIFTKKVGESDWVKLGTTVNSYFDMPEDHNVAGHNYQYMVRVVDTSNRHSKGAIVTANNMPNLVGATNPTKNVGVNTVTLKWENANPQLVAHYKIYMGSNNNRNNAVLYGTSATTEKVVAPLLIENYFFWIDTVGVDGSTVAMSNPISVSGVELGVKGGDISANTISWGQLTTTVRTDMEGYVSSANAAAQAANTSAQAAQVHANSANTAKTTAQNAASSANNSASAASTSASQASISANNSAQSAAASANSALTANTHAGTAKTYRDQAAVSKNDAAGSATAAATSAGVAVDAQNSAIALSRNPNFQFGKEGWKAYNTASVPLWDTVTVEAGVTGGKALKFSGDNLWFMSDNMIPVDTSRTYKMTIRVKAEGGLTRIYAGAITYDANGDLITGGAGSHRYFCANSRQIFAVDGWVTITGTITGEGNNHGDFRPGTSLIRPVVILQYNDSTATAAYIDEVTFEDIEESTNAAGHASAASTSASSAAASANSAGQSAASANSSKNSAETARSQALTYRNEAATSSTLAAEHSRLNMVGRSTFAPGEFAPWEDKYSVVSVTGHPNGQTYALRQTDRDLYTVASIVEQINNRVFRISGVVDNSNSPFEARAGIRIIKSDGNYHWPTVHIASANEGVKRFDVTLTISNNDYVDNQSFRFFLQSNGPSGSANGHRIDWSEVRYEDVTESNKAAQSASAAAIVEGVVTKTLGSENFSNPVFRTWKTSPNMPHGFGDVQINAGNRYFSRVPGKYYDAVQFTVLDKNSGSVNRPFCRIDSKYHNELELPSANKLDAVRVTLEVEKISGDWGGACSRVSWIRADDGGTNAHQYYYFEDNLSDENGVIQTVEFEMTKPDGFNPGTNPNGSYLALYFFGTSEYGGRVNQNVKWKLHRCSIKQITKGASTQISQKAVSDLEGNQSAAIVMRASTSNSALLELSSLKDAESGGSVTAARIAAESILLDGSVTANKLNVDGLLKISQNNGGFSIGKTSASDYANSGVFMGRDGSASNTGFGFFAGRRDVANNEQYIRIVQDSFTIRNAQFEISSDLGSTSSYASSGTYNLPAGTTTLKALEMLGGGGGGGSGASQNANGTTGQTGGTTTVELLDANNNVLQTWTGTGGAGGPGGRKNNFGDPGGQHSGAWKWSQKSPYGNGGNGGFGSNSRESGEAGRASPVTTINDYNVGAGRKIRVTIGSGGSGGFDTSDVKRGSPGASGIVVVTTEGEGVLTAGVLSQSPSVSGTIHVSNGVELPALGPGLWTVSGSNFSKEVDNHQIGSDVKVFVAKGRPKATSGNHTISYVFWPMK